MGLAWYNEIDPKAAAWLRELIKAGVIAPGDVDTRDIRDVEPYDLIPYTQCHFFAGIGVWSYALRLAGWSDDRPIWTGSCPCQPFSAAGKGAGFADERHLWPYWYHLIAQCDPELILGEQVASKDADPWVDLVQADLEALDYAFGAVPFPAAGVGAPNMRDRLYWLADADDEGSQRRRIRRDSADKRIVGARGLVVGLGDTSSSRGGRDAGTVSCTQSSVERSVRGVADIIEPASAIGGVGNSYGSGRETRDTITFRTETRSGQFAEPSLYSGLADADGGHASAEREQRSGEQRQQPEDGGPRIVGAGIPGPVNGYWRDADWILCRDPDGPRWRPVESGTFPLAHGAAARVGRLRGYGNAINAEAAAAFISAYLGN